MNAIVWVSFTTQTGLPTATKDEMLVMGWGTAAEAQGMNELSDARECKELLACRHASCAPGQGPRLWTKQLPSSPRTQL